MKTAGGSGADDPADRAQKHRKEGLLRFFKTVILLLLTLTQRLLMQKCLPRNLRRDELLGKSQRQRQLEGSYRSIFAALRRHPVVA